MIGYFNYISDQAWNVNVFSVATIRTAVRPLHVHCRYTQYGQRSEERPSYLSRPERENQERDSPRAEMFTVFRWLSDSPSRCGPVASSTPRCNVRCAWKVTN